MIIIYHFTFQEMLYQQMGATLTPRLQAARSQLIRRELVWAYRAPQPSLDSPWGVPASGGWIQTTAWPRSVTSQHCTTTAVLPSDKGGATAAMSALKCLVGNVAIRYTLILKVLISWCLPVIFLYSYNEVTVKFGHNYSVAQWSIFSYTGWPRRIGTAYFPQYVDAITGISVMG